MYEQKSNKTPQELQSKLGLKTSAAKTSETSTNGETPASFIEIISKRIDKLLAKIPPKSSAA